MKQTLTIGIPAYNEQENIGNLLADLSTQHQVGYSLDKIIVVSDASSDETERIVKNSTGSKVELIVNKSRRGLGTCLNTIFNHAKTNIVVTLDADIRLKDREFLAKLVKPITENKAEYTTTSIEELTPDTFFSESLAVSMQIKRALYQSKNGGNNIYTSFGLARAYGKQVYSQLRFPTSVGNDMYGYLYCKEHNFRYIHVHTAKARYYLPRTLSEHAKQSARFFHARQKMLTLFNANIVDNAFKLTGENYLQGFKNSWPIILRHPLHILSYFIFLSLSYVYSKIIQTSDRWVIATTTKGKDHGGTDFGLAATIRKYLNIALGEVQKSIGVKPLRLAIVCYHGIGDDGYVHKVTIEEFERQMAYLKKNYKIISLDELENFRLGKYASSRPLVAVTFDDGYSSILQVRPIVKQYDIRPTVFVLADPKNANRTEMGNEHELLSVNDIRLLQKEGWIIGSHTLTHPDLSTLGKYNLSREINGSKAKLEKALRTKINYLAYPKGRYSQSVLEIAKASGYSLAFSMDDHDIDENANKYSLPRIGINASHGFREFQTLLLPLNSHTRNILKKVI